MSAFCRTAMLLITILSCYALAEEQVHLQMKSEGPLTISWNGRASDTNANQIFISDAQGQTVTSLNVLRLVPEAKGVSIWDVSARGNMMGVAAVYESKQGNQQVHPVASLLLFDLTGQFLSAFALDPSRAISRLAVDDKSNVWTLTDGAGSSVDPSTVPMIVEYSADGRTLRELLKRNDFPLHAENTRSGSRIGWPAMGYDSGVVWFWLPGSTDLVTISTRDGRTEITKTYLPKKVSREVIPLSIFRESSGTVIADVREDDEQHRPEVSSEHAYYRWSPLTGSWGRFRPGPCETGRLIGASGNGQVYLRYDEGGRINRCMFRPQSAIPNGGPSRK